MNASGVSMKFSGIVNELQYRLKGGKLTSNDSHDLTLELCHRALDDRACHGNQTNSSSWLEIASPELLNCCQVPISS